MNGLNDLNQSLEPRDQKENVGLARGNGYWLVSRFEKLCSNTKDIDLRLPRAEGYGAVIRPFAHYTEILSRIRAYSCEVAQNSSSSSSV